MIFHSSVGAVDPVDGIPVVAAVQQGSQSWHEWRRQGIGGSDVPVILGVSPWNTPYGLWLEKTGRKAAFEGNFATARGQELEPVARAQYELQADCDMEPALIVHPEHSYMRVSLDGWNSALKRVLEIKCPGKEDHALAKSGEVPAKYMPQLQYQLMVAQAEVAHYYSFDGTSGVVVEVKPDPVMQDRIAKAVTEFWLVNVLDGVQPPLTDRDSLTVDDSEGLFRAYRNLASELKSLEERVEQTKQAIINRYGHIHARVSANGVELTRTERKGSVDYASVPEIKGVDLEQYRKPGTTVFTLRLSKA